MSDSNPPLARADFSTVAEAEAAAAVVAAIVGAPLAWSTTPALHAQGFTVARLEALEAAGILASWPLAGGMVWTLTPWSAEAAGVHLAMPRGILRWLGPGQARQPFRKPPGWNPWHKPARPPRVQYMQYELWEIDVQLWGQKIRIDPKIAPPSTGPHRRGRPRKRSTV